MSGRGVGLCMLLRLGVVGREKRGDKGWRWMRVPVVAGSGGRGRWRVRGGRGRGL